MLFPATTDTDIYMRSNLKYFLISSLRYICFLNYVIHSDKKNNIVLWICQFLFCRHYDVFVFTCFILFITHYKKEQKEVRRSPNFEFNEKQWQIVDIKYRNIYITQRFRNLNFHNLKCLNQHVLFTNYLPAMFIFVNIETSYKIIRH